MTSFNFEISSSIFRAYDIRGVVGQTLTPEIVYTLGAAIGSESRVRGERSVFTARDGRLSGPSLIEALNQGLQKSGCHVIDIGMVPTPVLYFATQQALARSGVMLTGSHNPPDYNGLKIVLAGETLAGEAIQGLYHRIRAKEFATGKGSYSQVDTVSSYLARIADDVKLQRSLRVVVDCGSGVAGVAAPQLLRALGCEVVELFCEVDGTFPHHHPDPSIPDNLRELILAVEAHQADLGLAFDGDGDRLGVVCNAGKIIWPDRQLMLYATDVLSRHPGATIIYDVKSSSHLEKVIRQQGGQPLQWKTGHSFIKAKLRETGALLAGEMSGHIFFKERWYGFDDALYAAARLLEILAAQSQSASAIFSALPDSVNTPELKLLMAEELKFHFVNALKTRILARQKELNAKITTIDGLRIDFQDGWGLIRPSNTTPCLILRFEADHLDALARIQNFFREQILALDESLILPF